MSPDVTLLFDGDCPLCRREVAWLLTRDNGRGRLAAVDIAAPGFDPGLYGCSQETLMARIHAVGPDGRIVEGVEVFRRAWGAVGLGWLMAWTAWPVLRALADAGYRVFARNRLRWTGRGGECADGRCVAHRP